MASAFPDRPLNKLVLFDVDDTLTRPRQVPDLAGRAMLTADLHLLESVPRNNQTSSRSTEESSHWLRRWI